MQQKFAGYCTALLLMVLFLSGCKKFEKEGHLQQAGIVLTFDDNNIENWYHSLDFLDSNGIRATFYISKYRGFTADQKTKLMAIQSRGHEIGYHTVNHYNMVDYVYKYHHTIAELVQNEITAGLALMNRDGLYPKTFAYPFGSHCDAIDNSLKRYFKSVRVLNGTNDYAKSLAPTDKNELLYGFGLDKSSNHTDGTIEKLLRSAKNNSACAILVGHKINSNINLSVSNERLKKIAALAKELNLKFYTASEISVK